MISEIFNLIALVLFIIGYWWIAFSQPKWALLSQRLSQLIDTTENTTLVLFSRDPKTGQSEVTRLAYLAKNKTLEPQSTELVQPQTFYDNDVLKYLDVTVDGNEISFNNKKYKIEETITKGDYIKISEIDLCHGQDTAPLTPHSMDLLLNLHYQGVETNPSNDTTTTSKNYILNCKNKTLGPFIDQAASLESFSAIRKVPITFQDPLTLWRMWKKNSLKQNTM